MNDIQIDMYPVGLGSSMLLQFTDDRGEHIRVLADGGVGRGKDKTTVQKLLVKDLLCDDRQNVRVDLMVGTHYDEDHLSGLVPILQDERFEIGEVWLPPVVNDAGYRIPTNVPIETKDALAHQLYDDTQSPGKLLSYLRAKSELISEVVGCLDRFATITAGEMGTLQELKNAAERLMYGYPDVSDFERVEAMVTQFRRVEICACICLHQLSNADGDSMRQTETNRVRDGISDTLIDLGHADDSTEYPPSNWDQTKTEVHGELYVRFKMQYAPLFGPNSTKSLIEVIEQLELKRSNDDTLHVASGLLGIVKGQARDAINARSLADVVNALRTRNDKGGDKTNLRCHMISVDSPLRLVWKSNARTFAEQEDSCSVTPTLTVMAPSDCLIRKHYDRLPVDRIALLVALHKRELEQVNASNQLSYVIRAEHKGQGILVSGDTGMVNFVRKVRKPREYHQNLLTKLMPLHVVQVAHHGGRNWHFYDVLLEAGFGRSKGRTYLLLSHAVDDPCRPSERFSQFMEDLDQEGSRAKVLFTSKPRHEKVRKLIQKVEPRVGSSGDEGTIRISFKKGRWTVERHSVRV